MRSGLVLSLSFSLAAHVVLLVPGATVGAGNSSTNTLQRPPPIVARLMGADVTGSQSIASEKTALPPLVRTTENIVAPSALPGATERAVIARATQSSSQTVPSLSADEPAISGLNGSSDIVYWPFDQVDEGALLLAEWPEAMVVAPWPSGQPVKVEVWVNPDGGVAKLQFSQQNLPFTLKMALTESISRYGFKPAFKNGEAVGNHRILELLLTETAVPGLAVR